MDLVFAFWMLVSGRRQGPNGKDHLRKALWNIRNKNKYQSQSDPAEVEVRSQVRELRAWNLECGAVGVKRRHPGDLEA